MMKKGLIRILSLCLVLLSFSISFAADPSGLIIVRASDNSLWKATCDGLTCTDFTNFPGMFGSQPAVYWDENIQRYVLWGRATDSTIWRSTFDRLGIFNNDWVSIPGLTASPLGAAGGGVTNTFSGSGQVHASITLSGSSVTNIKSVNAYAPWDGFFLCTASGGITHYRSSTSGTTYTRLYLTTTSGGTATTVQISELSGGAAAGYTHFPYAFQRWFSASPGHTLFYVTAEAGLFSGSSITVDDTMLSCQYFPYGF